MKNIDGAPVVHEIEAMRLAYGEYTDVSVVWAGYFGDGQPAFQLFSVDPHYGAELIGNANVSLKMYKMIPPEGHIFVPDYSEHSGKVMALAACGFAEFVEEVPMGHGHGALMKIKVDLPEMPKFEEVRGL